MRKRLLWIGILMMAGSVLLAAPEGIAQSAPAATESMLEQVMKRGVLRVGMSTFVPWAMQDKAGNFIGFEIDVANRLAQEMGVQAEFIPTNWSGIIPVASGGTERFTIHGTMCLFCFANPGRCATAHRSRTGFFPELSNRSVASCRAPRMVIARW